MFQPASSFDVIALRTFREGDVSAEAGERLSVTPLYAQILTTKGLARLVTAADQSPPAPDEIAAPETDTVEPVPVRPRRRGYRRKDLRVDA